MKTFSRKRTKGSLSFTDAWRELEDIMLNKPDIESQISYVFT